jgi:mono/diheme cytochrome c family protein
MPIDRRALAAVLTLAVPAAAVAADPPAKVYDDQVRPLLTRYCADCHGPELAKGGFRADTLTSDFADAANRERWQTAVRRVRAGEMPPKGKPRPTDAEARALATWADATEAARRAAAGRVPLRRLNRTEYENTVRDLLGITLELKDLLPPDSSTNGFDTNSDAQHVSSYLMEKYLDAADAALNVAIANGPRPPLVKKRVSLKDERYVKTTTERVFRHRDDDLVMFSSSAWNAITLGQFYPPDRGTYRFRLSVSAVQCGGKPVTFRVEAGPMLMGTKNHLVGYFDAPAGEPAVVEFTDHLEARSTIRILPYGLATAQTVTKVGADTYDGPGLAVQWVEVEGPLHETWPPASHRRIFGDLPQGPAPVFNNRNRVEVTSRHPAADADRVIRDFARRAFRRPVTDADVKPFVALAEARLADGSSFEQAVRAGLKGVLVSPRFLFLREDVGAASRAAPAPQKDGAPGPSDGSLPGVAGPARLAAPTALDDFALASRLSYFLWSTMPDDELLGLAAAKKLGEPAVLHGQVERMLKSPKARAFAENFVGQWLGLRDIDFTEPSHILYPEFDHLLKVSMVKEAELFFAAVLADDLPLTNFVASDFSVLNGRLSRHYGIPGVDGWEFRKVPLPAESHRGGMLTMAAVLKVTANGTSTSPVVRGAWVMDRILGTPPPKPPPDVPAVEPDIRGATTIREQLAKHRSVASCATCHTKIDPPGFALESFDVIGGYREFYRSSGNGKPVVIDGRRMPYLHGKKVDPSDVLPDGARFANVDELKQLLLRDKDQLARSLAEKLVTYGTGGPPEAADLAEVDAIVSRVRAGGYGFRTLVHEVVRSKLFQQK